MESRLEIDTHEIHYSQEEIETPPNGQSLTSKFSTIMKEDSTTSWEHHNEDVLETLGEDIWEIEKMVDSISTQNHKSVAQSYRDTWKRWNKETEHIWVIDGHDQNEHNWSGLSDSLIHEEWILKPPEQVPLPIWEDNQWW